MKCNEFYNLLYCNIFVYMFIIMKEQILFYFKKRKELKNDFFRIFVDDNYKLGFIGELVKFISKYNV